MYRKRELVRQRDVLMRAVRNAQMFTGTIMASPFWTNGEKKLAKPVDDELKVAMEHIEICLETDDDEMSSFFWRAFCIGGVATALAIGVLCAIGFLVF